VPGPGTLGIFPAFDDNQNVSDSGSKLPTGRGLLPDLQAERPMMAIAMGTAVDK